MLSEDEKQAIRNLENLSEFGLSATLNQADLDKMKIVLNLITKLEKELKEQTHKKTYARQNVMYKNKQLGKARNKIKKLQKENEELKSDNLEKARILEIFDDRKYRKKYLEERRKEEPNLLYPDADEIYRKYYELKKQIDLIIEEYEFNDRINFKNFCEDKLRKDNCIQDCKACAKQYFQKLAKEKENKRC